MYDTETMAELCVKQGLVDRAIDIYRRLSTDVTDPASRRRYLERMTSLQRKDARQDDRPSAPPAPVKSGAERPASSPLGTPGLRVTVEGDQARIQWQLAPETQAPVLQALLLRRTSEGIQTETRTLSLASAHGELTLRVAGLHSVRAAAGRLSGEAFVPLIRVAPVSPDADPM